MDELFLQLSAPEQSQILRGLAPQLARQPQVLEKDLWVCWTLQTLFAMPGRLPMAFKGGTSLSKVFGVIARFSEDVDITLDYRHLDPSANPFADGITRSQLKKLSEHLKSVVCQHVHEQVLPHFQSAIEPGFAAGEAHLEISDDGEKLWLAYPSVLDDASDYLAARVLIEFGGRNAIEPNAEHEVQPDIAPYVPTLGMPVAHVSVLAPERTFWEKATLMHVACQAPEFKASADRQSRHWYDLAMLADHAIGQRALTDHVLLADVVRHKKAFFHVGYANYDACLAQQFRLLPDAAGRHALRADFEQMVNAGMFIGTAPDFALILERLTRLERAING